MTDLGKWFAHGASQMTVKRSMLKRSGNSYQNVTYYARVWRAAVILPGRPVVVERCRHDHNKPATARKCAVTLAARLNREAGV